MGENIGACGINENFGFSKLHIVEPKISAKSQSKGDVCRSI